jgi:molybdate transport system substrate-binding protein
MRAARRILLAILLGCAGAGAAAQTSQPAREAGNPAGDQPMTVFAAASLADVLRKIGDSFTQATKIPLRYSFAASSTLAKQIEQGAGASVFFSADEEWMDYLASRSLIDDSSRRDIVANRLVLIAPATSRLSLKIAPHFPLVEALGREGHLATGDPDDVPVGKYAKASLTQLDVWEQVEPRVVRTENVRIALEYVARGEAPLGIVYATDARVDSRVRIVDVFEDSLHKPIVYPAAATRPASAQAQAFIDYLAGAEATRIFREAGFIPPSGD